MEDMDIIDLFFARDEDAVIETRAKYGARLYKTSLNILGNFQDSEEIVNDTLLKAWESIPPNRPLLLGAYVAKIARNLAINKYRARSAAKRGGGEADALIAELGECIGGGVEPEKAYEKNQLSLAINEFLAKQSKEARVIFVLRYFHGESILGLADRLSMSESKIKSVLFRTRKKLQEHLKKEELYESI